MYPPAEVIGLDGESRELTGLLDQNGPKTWLATVGELHLLAKASQLFFHLFCGDHSDRR